MIRTEKYVFANRKKKQKTNVECKAYTRVSQLLRINLLEKLHALIFMLYLFIFSILFFTFEFYLCFMKYYDL